MTKEEIQEKAKRIEIIHKSYLDKLLDMKKQQDKIIEGFSEILKNKKIEKIKKLISSL